MKPTRTRPSLEKSRLQLIHQYYSYTGFYSFVWNTVKKVLPYIVLAILGVYILNQFVDINAYLVHFTEALPVYAVLVFFLVSETLLGIIPPEICLAWAAKMESPWMYLNIFAFLSYFGGLLSYHLGSLITKIPSVHSYLELKMEKQLKNSKKWGGFLIVVGALLPLPFATSCMAAGIIKYPFKKVMLLGSLRILRILLYGLIIFHIF